jgi:hypothetical protein
MQSGTNGVVTNMYRKNFLRLVAEICAELDLPPCDSDLKNDETLIMEMGLEGIGFSVVHTLTNHPERIMIEANFGPLPQERRTAVLYRMLHLNRELAEAGQAVFTLDGTSGNVIYTHAVQLADSTGKEVLGTMTDITWRGEHWKKTWFLDEGKRGDDAVTDQRWISLA